VLFDLLFSAGLFAGARARTAVMTGVFVLIGTASVVIGLALADLRVSVFVALQLTGLLVIPLWWAANLRQQHELGRLNAEQARREAIDAERAAMARDLHDIIAAHLSTTAIHSAAALALPAEPGRDRAALRAVRESSLAALEEMRSMITLLRADGGGETVAAAGLERLPELVASARATGLDVTLDSHPQESIPALVDHTAYRIINEALTNARKHSPGAEVRVTLHPLADRLDLTVTNTLTRPAQLGHGALSAGTGLPGMTERAELLGGTVTAGPEGDLWVVRASLPLRGTASGATSGAASGATSGAAT
jgi:signal transduction histidine kinase